MMRLFLAEVPRLGDHALRQEMLKIACLNARLLAFISYPGYQEQRAGALPCLRCRTMADMAMPTRAVMKPPSSNLGRRVFVHKSF